MSSTWKLAVTSEPESSGHYEVRFGRDEYLPISVLYFDAGGGLWMINKDDASDIVVLPLLAMWREMQGG